MTLQPNILSGPGDVSPSLSPDCFLLLCFLLDFVLFPSFYMSCLLVLSLQFVFFSLSVYFLFLCLFHRHIARY